LKSDDLKETPFGPIEGLPVPESPTPL